MNDLTHLQKLDPTGKVLAQWDTAKGTGELGNTLSLAVDGQGNIYVIADAKITVQAGTFDLPVLKKFKQP